MEISEVPPPEVWIWHIHCLDILTEASLNSHKSLPEGSWNYTVIPTNLWLHFLNIK